MQEEAHDIVNKEINVILKGCGKFVLLERKVDDYTCGDISFSNKIMLCSFCKGKLKGIISMEASEIEFLESLDFLSRYKSCDGCALGNEKLLLRLQALKISMEDLQERVK